MLGYFGERGRGTFYSPSAFPSAMRISGAVAAASTHRRRSDMAEGYPWHPSPVARAPPASGKCPGIRRPSPVRRATLGRRRRPDRVLAVKTPWKKNESPSAAADAANADAAGTGATDNGADQRLSLIHI